MSDDESPEDLRVLVVDDVLEVATALEYLLQLLGCRTATAFGAEMGLRLFELFKPHVVFIDVGMPGADGFEMIGAAKQMPEVDPSTMFVCYSGKSDESHALAAGFDRFVAKPMPPEVLTEILDEARARLVVARTARPKLPSSGTTPSP